MSSHGSDPVNDALQRQRALSRWANDGGAGADGPLLTASEAEGQPLFPRMGDAEFEALHVRITALENLVISLLVASSDQEREHAREMAYTKAR